MTGDPRPDFANVLIIDDHALISTALAIALRSRGVDATRSEAADPDSLRAILTALNPGVAVVDVDLGVDPFGRPLSGTDLLPLLVGAGWRVIMFSGTVPESELAAAVAAGADGWLHKKAPFDELLAAVLAAARGEELITPVERERLVQETRRPARPRARPPRLTSSPRGRTRCCGNSPPASARRRSPRSRWCR